MASALMELSEGLADAVEQAGRSAVTVSARRRLGATGIVWGDELVVTAAHVLEQPESITVTLPDGERTTAEAVGIDEGVDLAVLRAPGSGTGPARPAWAEARPGLLALAVGRPSGEGLSASLGVVSAVGGRWRTRAGTRVRAHLRTDARMLPGFSGGPLVGADGAVFGMNTSLFARDGGFTIPHAVLGPLVESLSTHGRLRRAFLGVATQPARLGSGGDERRGLLVTAVDAEGPAASAGVMVGDVLLSFGGEAVSDTADLLDALGPERIGQATAVEVLRAGEVRALSITPGERGR